MPSHHRLELRNPGFSAFLAWLVPGLGHWYQGRRGKAVLYFVCILGLFVYGMKLGAWRNVYFRWDAQEQRYVYIAQAGVGLAALPAVISTADLRSILPASISWFEAPPAEDVMDDLHRQYGKRMDIAVVYTVIAGLLNLLVIYDAAAGPALYDQERRLLGKEDDPAKGEGAAA